MMPWYYRTEDLVELQKKILEDINYVEVIFVRRILTSRRSSLEINSSLFFHCSTFRLIENTYHYFRRNLIQINMFLQNKVEFSGFYQVQLIYAGPTWLEGSAWL